MKIWSAVILMLALIAVSLTTLAEKAPPLPRYDPSTEGTFKGTVESTSDHQCPVSGGLGSHVVLKLGDGKTIEVHLAATKFVKMYELAFNKGDEIEVTGSKVTFEGVETILAREVKRGNDTFVFRDKQGNPVW